jgi:hypothetical protein
LDTFADRRAADRETLNQVVLRWQLAAYREFTAGDASRDLCFEDRIERSRVG